MQEGLNVSFLRFIEEIRLMTTLFREDLKKLENKKENNEVSDSEY